MGVVFIVVNIARRVFEKTVRHTSAIIIVFLNDRRKYDLEIEKPAADTFLQTWCFYPVRSRQTTSFKSKNQREN